MSHPTHEDAGQPVPPHGPPTSDADLREHPSPDADPHEHEHATRSANPHEHTCATPQAHTTPDANPHEHEHATPHTPTTPDANPHEHEHATRDPHPHEHTCATPQAHTTPDANPHEHEHEHATRNPNPHEHTSATPQAHTTPDANPHQHEHATPDANPNEHAAPRTHATPHASRWARVDPIAPAQGRDQAASGPAADPNGRDEVAPNPATDPHGHDNAGPNPATVPNVDDASAGGPVADRRTVLIVDDSLTVRMNLHEAFEAGGFRSILCADGAEARAAFDGAHFDVAVLDVRLPDADGVELLRELRANPGREGTVTVLLSSEAEVADRLHGLRTGADEYVGKPYDAGHIVARARQLLGDDQFRTDDRTTVLVIDDSLTFRERLRELLEPEGYAVITANSGEEGLRTAADRRPQAVIVDGFMPGIDGATVIRRLRLDPTLRDIPCLLMTASDDYATELQMLEAGADAFVRKQQDLAVVLAKLAAVLRTSAEQLPVEVTGSRHGPGKVLTVTTDRDRRHALGDALRDDGYDVVAAATGADALDLLAAQPVDCIVLSLDDSGADAREICRRIKEVPQIGETPVIMIGDDDGALLDCLAAGADDYVQSADGVKTLQAHVRGQIRRKQSLDESRRIREELMRRELDAAGERAARHLAETRAALVEELEWRNEELEAFSGSVSHDLRGPLQIISSFAETILDEEEGPLSAQVRHRVQRIHAAAERMAVLVDSLLILARASRGELRRQRFDMTAAIWQMIGEVQAREPGRDIRFTVTEAMTADGDEELVRVVLDNLINNACKFTRRVAKAVIEIGWSGPGENPRYSIRDNGAGFPAGKSVELFRPFARLHKAADFPGTGIGLTTVHRIVERHGGEIHAEGEEGRGATFWFTLPPVQQ